MEYSTIPVSRTATKDESSNVVAREERSGTNSTPAVPLPDTPPSTGFAVGNDGFERSRNHFAHYQRTEKKHDGDSRSSLSVETLVETSADVRVSNTVDWGQNQVPATAGDDVNIGKGKVVNSDGSSSKPLDREKGRLIKELKAKELMAGTEEQKEMTQPKLPMAKPDQSLHKLDSVRRYRILVEEVTSENSYLKERLAVAEARASHASEIERFLEQSEEIISNLEKKNEELALTNSEFSEKLHSVEGQQGEELSRVRERNEVLSKTLDSLRGGRQAAQQELEISMKKTKQKDKEINSLNTRVKELEVEVERARVNGSDLTADLTGLRTSVKTLEGDNQKLEKKIKEMEERDASLTMEVRDLKKTNNKLESAMKVSTETLCEERDIWREKHETLLRKKEQLESRYNDHINTAREKEESAIARYDYYLRERDSTIASLEQKREKQEEIVEELFEKIEKYKDENSSLRREHDNIQAEADRVISKMEEASSSAKAADEEKTNLLNKCNERERKLLEEIEKCNRAIRELEGGSERWKAKCEAMEKTLAEMEKDSIAHATRSKENEQKATKLQLELDKCTKQLVDSESNAVKLLLLEKDRTELEERIEKLGRSFQHQLMEKDAEMRQEQEALSSYREELRSQVLDFEQKWRECQEKKAQLKLTNAKLDDRLRHYMDQQKQMMEEINRSEEEKSLLQREASALRVQLLKESETSAKVSKLEATIRCQRDEMANIENEYSGLVVELQRKAGQAINCRKILESELRESTQLLQKIKVQVQSKDPTWMMTT